MKKISSLAVALTLFVQPTLTKDDIVVRIHLFQGLWMEESPGLKDLTILRTSSFPALASLKLKVNSSESELKTAVIEALLDIMDLRSVDELFSVSKKPGESPRGSSEIILCNLTAFRIDLAAKRLLPRQVVLRVALSKSKDGVLQPRKSPQEELQRASEVSRNKNLMEVIADQDLIIDFGDPVIVAAPYKDRAYCLLILVTSGSESSRRSVNKETKAPQPVDILTSPSPICRVQPAYPEELRQKGVAGEVGLRLTIDREGGVVAVTVVRPLHPYLDYLAVRAVRQWKFEPALKKGQGVPARFTLTVGFNPETYGLLEDKSEAVGLPPAQTAPPTQPELPAILDRCAEYCYQLASSALDFVCEETIKETHFSFGEGNLWGGLGSGTIEGQRKPIDPEQEWDVVPSRPISSELRLIAAMPLFDPGQTRKNKYNCDYQLIKKGEKIEERRILLKENGRKVADLNRLLEEKKFFVLNPLFASARLLERGRQPLFSYQLLEDEKVGGEKTYVLEAVPKPGKAGSVEYARIWVDKKSFQILQSEITGIPLEGYEDVLEDATRYNLKPIFTARFSYQVEKNGVLFPSRSEIRVVYQSLVSGQNKATKIKTDITYDRYRFFTVETDHEIRQ